MNPVIFEESAAIHTLVAVRSAMAISGIDAVLFRQSDHIKASDEVYGIYGGTKVIEEVKNDAEPSNPYGILSADHLDDDPEDVELFKFPSSDTAEEIHDANYGDGEEIRVLMPSSQWRVGSFDEFGGYESGATAWVLDTTDLKVGDVIAINRPYSGTVRFKVVWTEIVGVTNNIAVRFKLANVG